MVLDTSFHLTSNVNCCAFCSHRWLKRNAGSATSISSLTAFAKEEQLLQKVTKKIVVKGDDERTWLRYKGFKEKISYRLFERLHELQQADKQHRLQQVAFFKRKQTAVFQSMKHESHFPGFPFVCQVLWPPGRLPGRLPVSAHKASFFEEKK